MRTLGAVLVFLAASTALADTEYERAIQTLPLGTIGGGCPGVGLPTAEQEALRDRYYSTFGWPILTETVVDRVASFIGDRGAVDFGAGSGYFSYLLNERGIDVFAIDDRSWGTPPKVWHPVKMGGHGLLAGTSNRVLILSWPPRKTGMATLALAAWGGSRLVYAGEILRGAGEPTFFRELAENWHLAGRVSVPQWHNRSDAIFFFERRNGAGDGSAWLKGEMLNCLGSDDR
jgi:hypothetical protein